MLCQINTYKTQFQNYALKYYIYLGIEPEKMLTVSLKTEEEKCSFNLTLLQPAL